MLDPQSLITDRLRAIDASGIRKVFDLAKQLPDPINLSIGQPDFDVPPPIRAAAAHAIDAGHNSYTVTQGLAELHHRVAQQIDAEFQHDDLWNDYGSLIISGVSGGLLLALMTCVGPGDEVILGDPYFVMYKHLITLTGGTAVFVDTYPDFQLTADRVEPLISDRTKMLMLSSPSNPTGVVVSPQTCADLAALCRDRGVLLLSDEIYDEFCYEKVDSPLGPRCPSPANHSDDLLIMRGFSKTYAMTGWRLGYTVGPRPIIDEMTKLQQYTFVCAPSMVQHAGVVAMDVDMSDHVAAYARKRDMVIDKLSPHFKLTAPGGAFYAFPKAPNGHTGTSFVEQAIANNVLIIPGNVFSEQDTHFRLSYACDDNTLEKGLDILVSLAT
ncbi:MAG: aspartate aminotransferase [Planctomycetaceae bacterium]|nr:aspartate aminotransferase [Planctomycetaceae bacterium]